MEPRTEHNDEYKVASDPWIVSLPNLTGHVTVTPPAQVQLSVFEQLLNEYLEEEEVNTRRLLYQELWRQIDQLMEENQDLKTLVHLFHKTGIMEDYTQLMDQSMHKT